MCVIPKCCRVYTDLAERAPPMNRLLETEVGFSVLAASDIKAILSRMCSSLTYNYQRHMKFDSTLTILINFTKGNKRAKKKEEERN